MYDLKDDRWIKNANELKTASKKVILTFDDGPSRNLNRILDILKEKDVPAIFFWQSKLLYKERPWQRVLDEGHVIGAHSLKHKNLVNLNYEEQYKQIFKSVEQIEEITENKVVYFRPPFGQYNEDTMTILHELGLTPIMWDISSYDWMNKDTPQKIVCNVVNHISGGSIILLHELEQTVAILSLLIDRVRKKGYEFSLLQ